MGVNQEKQAIHSIALYCVVIRRKHDVNCIYIWQHQLAFKQKA